MGYLRLKRLPLWLYALAIVCSAGAVYETVGLVQSARIKHALAHPETIKIDETTPAILVFAKARKFSQTGHDGEAIRLYASLRNTPDLALRERALHNLGTLYLRDAATRWNARGVLEAAHVGTQVELAKDSYREVLRLNPNNWDARFNLEYAYRITPPPREQAKADFQGSKSSVFSTLPGLPVGGP
ncbi:MAG: MxaK protein [Candidatus Methylumidiphilus sp.]